MRTKLSTTGFALLALTVSGLVACGQGTDQSAVDLDTALHQDYAGLDEADEAPDFDDADLAAAEDLNADDEVAIDDPTTDADGTLEQAEQDSAGARKLIISVMWGHLRPQPDAAEATDWTGVIAIKNGALRVLRTLRFEGTDHLGQRPGIRAVPFVSHTRPHADGLLLEVILHPSLVTEPDSPPVLLMQTAAYEDALVLVPGMRLSRVVRVDETGNAVAYHIFRPPTAGCKEGLMVGRYTEAETTEDGRTVGHMKGKYLSFDGRVVGKMRGLWGERENGAQVFFSKVINREGEFIGVLAGRYADGKYRGRYLGREREITGAAMGIYREASEEQGGGFFMGRWSVGCGELSSEGQADASDEANEVVDAELPGEE